MKTYEQFNEMIQRHEKPWETTELYLNKYNPLKHYDIQLNASGPLLTQNLSFFQRHGSFQRQNLADGAFKNYSYLFDVNISVRY